MSFTQSCAFLANTQLQALLPHEHKNILTHDHNDSVGAAMHTLAENNILSAPVLLAASIEDSDGGSYLGIVDVMCLLGSVLKSIGERGGLPAGREADVLATVGKELLERKLITIMGHDASVIMRNSMTESLLDAIRNGSFRTDSRVPLHRIAVFNVRGDITGIISQSDVARYLHKHQHELGSVLNTAIEELALVQGGAGVATVPVTASALEAFARMQQSGVGAVAVMEGNELVANLSASDLRGLTPDAFPTLLLPITGFLAVSRVNWDVNHPGAAQEPHTLVTPPVVCSPRSTLGEVLELLVTRGVHRVYVLPPAGSPADSIAQAGRGGGIVGVVSITDILRLFAALSEQQ